ncbi:MAG: hypothetical protein ACXVCL_20290 [Bdellovibrio sp.]
MANWQGGTKYSHTPGDRFIFKGGVTWDKSNFEMDIAGDGTSTSPDYYGVDKSWFNGSTWSRPIFDGENAALPRGSDIISIANRNYITIDNIEIKRHMATSNWGTGCLTLYCSQNILMSNLWVHDWSLAASVTNDDTHGGIIGNFPSCSSEGTWVDHSEISNAERTNSGRKNGGATRIVNVRYSKIHDVGAAMLFGQVHDSEIYNVGYPSGNETFDPTTFHTNVLYIEGWNGGVAPANPALIYNNYIHDVNTGSGAIYPNPCSAGAPIYIYNNVVKNSVWNGVVLIDTYNYGAAGTCGQAYIYNNTFQINSSNNGFSTVRVTSGGDRPVLATLDMKNNHSINDNGFFAGRTIVNLLDTNNISQTNTEAFGQGYTDTQKYVYSPTLNNSATVNAGVNLSGNCTALLKDLCVDTSYAGARSTIKRPSSGSWNVGAYQLPSGSLILQLAAPLNLRINP